LKLVFFQEKKIEIKVPSNRGDAFLPRPGGWSGGPLQIPDTDWNLQRNPIVKGKGRFGFSSIRMAKGGCPTGIWWKLQLPTQRKRKGYRRVGKSFFDVKKQI